MTSKLNKYQLTVVTEFMKQHHSHVEPSELYTRVHTHANTSTSVALL